MGRRLLGVLAAVLLAAIGTTILVAYVRGAEDRALAGEQTVDVLVAAEPIAQAAKAEDLALAVRTERVPLKVRAEGSVASLEELSGQVAAVDLLPGEQIVKARFMTPTALAEQTQVEVPEGMQEVTISIDPQRAVGGQILPGDTVGLVATVGTEEEQAATKFLLRKMLITRIHVEQLPPAPGEEVATTAGPELAPTGNLLVTLAVDTAQAERIVYAAENGTIWLTAEPQTASEGGSQLRTPENIHD